MTFVVDKDKDKDKDHLLAKKEFFVNMSKTDNTTVQTIRQ